MNKTIQVIAMTLLMSVSLCGASKKNLARADALDSQAAGYERAADALRLRPVAKNIAAPNTAARYAATAKRLHQEARELRAKP